MTPRLPERTQNVARVALIDCMIVAIATLWTLWPFFVHPGIPSYQHDWSWPFLRERSCDALTTLGSTWLPEGLGHANPFANANPVNYAILGLGCVLPQQLAVRICIVLCALIAGAGALVLARTLVGVRGARLGAFAYLALPVFFNKVSAGQFAFLAAFAALPWVYIFLHRISLAPRARLVSACALVMAACMVQPQYFVFVALASAIFCISMQPPLPATLAVVAAYLLALALNAPAIWSALSLNAGFGYTVQHPQLEWEFAQSADLGHALVGLGYISAYADEAYARMPFASVALVLLRVVCIVALIALFARRARFGNAFGITALVAILVMSGARGPLAPLFLWGFAHVRAAALFRELYHVAPFLALAYAIGIAVIAERLSRTLRWLLAFGFALATLPLCITGHSVDLQFHVMPADVRALNASVAALGPTRMLPLPYRMPIAWGVASRAGVDVLAYVDSRHPSAAEYAPTPTLDAIMAIAQEHPLEARDLLARHAIGVVARRRELRAAVSAQYFGPARRAASAADSVFDRDDVAFAALTGSGRCSADCAGIVPDALPMVGIASRVARTAIDRAAFRAGVSYVDAGPPDRSALVESGSDTDPYEGWVSAAQWAWLDPAWAQLIDLVAVTAVPATIMVVPGPPGRRLAYVARAPLEVCAAGHCVRLRASERPQIMGLSAEGGSIRSFGPAGVAEVADPARYTVSAHAPAHLVRVDYIGPYEYRGILQGNGASLLVLRQSYDPSWFLVSTGVRKPIQVRADGFANAWLVDVQGLQRFTVVFQPQRVFAVWRWFSFGLYVLVFGFTIGRTAWSAYQRKVAA